MGQEKDSRDDVGDWLLEDPHPCFLAGGGLLLGEEERGVIPSPKRSKQMVENSHPVVGYKKSRIVDGYEGVLRRAKKVIHY